MPDSLPSFLMVAGLGLAALALTILVLYLLDAAWNRRPADPLVHSLIDLESPGVRVLFDDRELVLASRDAQSLLAADTSDTPAWDRITDLAGEVFANAASGIEQTTVDAPLTLRNDGATDTHTLRAERRAGFLYLAFDEACFQNRLVSVDPAILRENEAELQDLRALLGESPVPVWKLSAEDQVHWANPAYLQLVKRALPDISPTWPYPVLFDADALSKDPGGTRLVAGGGPHGTATPAANWYTCHVIEAGDERLCYALPASDAVAAETALHGFVETLTDTFAHLTTGLAVFDNDRRLTLFNPALVELTGLDPAWASARPNLATVLDRLRELRVVPEPKDYKSWRDQIVRLEEESRQGSYREDWALPDGRTFRVTGRPHPRGAVALLLEDVTPELSQARRFRAELDLSHAVLDHLDEAVAVFSPQGTVMMSNTAYSALWDHHPDQSLVDVSIADCTRIWAAECSPSPAWGDLREFVSRPGDRTTWSVEFARNGGDILSGCFKPLPGGGTLVGFVLRKASAVVARPKQPAQPRARTG